MDFDEIRRIGVNQKEKLNQRFWSSGIGERKVVIPHSKPHCRHEGSVPFSWMFQNDCCKAHCSTNRLKIRFAFLDDNHGGG